jgi:sulfur relay (sulfurtransferase) DsrC/TusE family protein
MATSHFEAFLNDGEFDEDGFLKGPRHRDEQPAERIAEADGPGELAAAHWRILSHLREHCLKYHTIPVMRHVCRVTHPDPHCVPDLFGQSSRAARRVAGLPDPGEEAGTCIWLHPMTVFDRCGNTVRTIAP